MDRFDILDTGGEDRTFFDHCLYRSLLFPQTCYEVTPEGKAVHRDFAHNRIQEGKYFTSLGFWDLFRTTFPLYSLVYPELYQEFLEASSAITEIPVSSLNASAGRKRHDAWNPH